MHTGSFRTLQPIRIATSQTRNYIVYSFILLVLRSAHVRSYGVMAITLDFESNNPSSNLGRTFPFCQIISTVCNGHRSIDHVQLLFFRLIPSILVETVSKIMSHGMTHTSGLLQEKFKHDSLLPVESNHIP